MAPRNSSILDLDALIADDLAAAKKNEKWNKIKLFEREWRVTTQPNAFAAVAGSFGDAQALVSLVVDLIHPDEQVEFRNTVIKMRNLNNEVLMTIINGLLEAASEHPTKSPSGSSRASATTRGAKPKSAAT